MLVFFTTPVSAHPTGIHTAKHTVELSIHPQFIQLTMSVTVPHTVEQTFDHEELHDLFAHVLLEVDTKTIHWTKQRPKIVPQNDDTTIHAVFTAALPRGAKHVRVSNGTLPLTRAFYSNRISHSPVVTLENVAPQYVGKGANVEGRWTMDNRAREISFDMGVKNSVLDTIHAFIQPDTMDIPYTSSHTEGLIDSWVYGRHTPLLTVLVVLVHLLIGCLFVTMRAQRRRYASIAGWIALIGVIMWSQTFATPAWVIASIVVILVAPFAPSLWPTEGATLRYVGLHTLLSLSYGTPRLLLATVPFLLVSAPHDQRFNPRRRKLKGVLQYISMLSLVIVCLWRLLAF